MYLAIDIGATKTLIATFTEKGEIKSQHKIPTPDEYKDLVKEISTYIEAELSSQSFKKAIVAVPGTLDRDNGIGIAFGNRPWRNIPITRDLEEALRCPVVIENDTKLAGLYEACVIKEEYRKALYITVSTGISAGLIIDGKIDPNLANSEGGQMWFDYKGKLTQWEDFASGSAIVKKYNKRASEIQDPEIWDEIAKNISVGVIELIAIIQPEVIIFGGGVGGHFKMFEKPLLKYLHELEQPITPTPPLRVAARPEEAVIYGCMELADQLK